MLSFRAEKNLSVVTNEDSEVTSNITLGDAYLLNAAASKIQSTVRKRADLRKLAAARVQAAFRAMLVRKRFKNLVKIQHLCLERKRQQLQLSNKSAPSLARLPKTGAVKTANLKYELINIPNVKAARTVSRGNYQTKEIGFGSYVVSREGGTLYGQ